MVSDANLKAMEEVFREHCGLTFDEYQQEARKTAVYPGQGTLAGLSYTIHGLTSESGECAGKMKKIYRDNDGVITEDSKNAIISETSDVLWYCAAIASELGISLGDIARYNIEKLAARQNKGTIKGSGDSR